MDLVDIRLCIFEHIYNVYDLLNFGIIDNISRNILSTKSFWIKQFDKFGLEKSSIFNNVTKVNNYHEWVMKFLQCKYVTDKTNLIIDYLESHIIYNVMVDFNMSLNTFINILKRHNYSYIPNPDNFDSCSIILNQIYLGKSYIGFYFKIAKHEIPDIYVNNIVKLKNILSDINGERCKGMSIKQLI